MADYQPLDDQTKKDINNRVAGALSLTGDYQTDVQNGLLPKFEPEQVNYGNEGVSGAIAKKYGKISEDHINQIKKLNEMNAPKESFNKIRGAADLASKQYRIDYQQQMAIRQRVMAEESQRAQLLGSLLGVAGVVGGAMIGGPAGAMVGGAAGQAAARSTAGGGQANTMGNDNGSSYSNMA